MHTSQKIKTRGITIHPIPGLTVKGIHVHDNHVVETLAEGIYIGSEPHAQPYAKLGKVENVEIDHNLVERSGYDGIKLKVGLGSVSIHDNVVHDAGQLGDPAHQGGIKTAFAGGDYYNNTIIGGVEGIRMDRVLPVDPTRYFNNLVVGVKSVGIQTSQDHAAIYNNTIVRQPGGRDQGHRGGLVRGRQHHRRRGPPARRPRRRGAAEHRQRRPTASASWTRRTATIGSSPPRPRSTPAHRSAGSRAAPTTCAPRAGRGSTGCRTSTTTGWVGQAAA